MESKAIPKAKQYFDKEYGNQHIETVVEMADYVSLYDLMHEYAVLFAKYHREKAIEATVNNFYTNYIGLKSKAYIKQDLENAYSEDNIK